jgi:tRNA (guanine10-N2)-dimethyltransferase
MFAQPGLTPQIATGRHRHHGAASVSTVYVLELAGEDDAFASREAGAAVPRGSPTVQATGIATAEAIEPDRVRWLAMTHHASEVLVRTSAAVDTARDALEAASIDRTGSVAVRARDARSSTGIDTQAVERTLGSVLVDRGFTVDLEAPDHELRAVFGAPSDATHPDDGVGFLGWHVASSRRDFGARRPTDRPFFQPGSMEPLLARAVVNLAGARPGRTICDPLCGTGGLLLEAGLVGAGLVGLDVQRQMVAGTRSNLQATLGDSAALGDRDAGPPTVALAQADATRLPIVADTTDAVVFDAPYGRQSKIAGQSADALVSEVLGETARIAPRAVVVADRPLEGPVAESPWTLSCRHERRVHRSLVRHVHELER